MCKPWELGCQLEEGASNLAGSAVEEFVQALADGAKNLLGYVSTFWMEVPSPKLATGSGQNWQGTDLMTSMQQYLMPITAAICVMSMAFALLKVGFNPEQSRAGFTSIGRQMVAVLLATLPAWAVSQVLIMSGDEFSPWIIEQASGHEATDGFKSVLIEGLSPGAPSEGLGMWLVIFLLAIIASLVQCLFMVLRGAAILVLFALLAPAAAASATEEGWQRYKRLLMVVLGFILYKPVAAVIYATGMRLMSDNSGDEVQNAIYGLTVLAMAALALPALIKFLMPAAAVGSSSAFSGGAAVGAVAGGAAIVALAGSGGASGAAAGAGSGTAGGAAGGADGAAGAAGGATGGGSGPAGGADPSGTDPSGTDPSGAQTPGVEGGSTGSASGAGTSESGSTKGSAEGADGQASSGAGPTEPESARAGATAPGAETTSATAGETGTRPSTPNGAGQRSAQAVAEMTRDTAAKAQAAADETADGAGQ